MLKKWMLLTVLCGLPALLHGQTGEKNDPFSFEGTYTGDFYGNAAGGLQTGGGFMGMGNLTVGFDTEKARWWKGGSFFVNGASIHGKSLSENYTSDLQIASNIDAGTHAYLHELWFRQQIGRVSFALGLQDLNAEFMASDNAGEFINSSFGIPPVISANLPVPIFPLTGLGVSVHWDIDDRFSWHGALFDGEQAPFETNPHNLRWRFSREEGAFAVTEFQAHTKKGTYKLGTYYHSNNHNYGAYFIGDHTILDRGERRLNLFVQLAAAPQSRNAHAYYLGLGANCYGIFSGTERDALGFALAGLDLQRAGHSHETALELYYKYRVNNHVAIQPDVQYILNPSGTEAKLPHALVALLRLHVHF